MGTNLGKAHTFIEGWVKGVEIGTTVTVKYMPAVPTGAPESLSYTEEATATTDADGRFVATIPREGEKILFDCPGTTLHGYKARTPVNNNNFTVGVFQAE
jgi:hypothetical protein